MVKSKTLNKRGGASTDLVDIIQALLEMKVIMFLPKTSIVTDQSKYNTYFSSVDSKTLLYLVKEYDVGNLRAIQQIFGGPGRDNPPQIQNASEKLLENLNLIKPDLNNVKDFQYYEKFLKLNANLQLLEGEIKGMKNEIDTANMQLSNFQCIEGLDNEKNEFLTNFILDCSKYCNRDVDWYRVLLNIDKLDEDFETEVLKLVNKNTLQLDYNSIKNVLNQLESNTELKNIFRDRLMECSKSPYSFFDTLTGSISFDSLNDCQKCHNDCILYLNDNYKSFLMNDTDGIGISNKLKALMYCEFRLYQLSKAISLEALRIKKKKYSKVKNILKNLSSKEKKEIIQKNINEKKRGENILKVQKLEKKQKEDAKELDKLISEKTNNVLYKGDKKGGSRGGADIDENLMKQNIISQILQVLANDKSINNPGLQQQIDKIKVDNPIANVVGKPNPLANVVDKPNPMANVVDKPNPIEGSKNNIVNVPNAPIIDKPSMVDRPSMDKPIKQPLENPIKQPVINKPVIDEIVPNCTAIAKDIMDGKINETNFLYLSPQCDTQIMNALKSSR
tara:strand:- start:4661 stop:6343 length:1683 start_codon:yes stop_codon:yes gene_type:complete